MEAALQKAEEIQQDKISEKSKSKDDEVHSTTKSSNLVGNDDQVAKKSVIQNTTHLEAQISSHATQKNTPGESVPVPIIVPNITRPEAQRTSHAKEKNATGEPVKQPTTLQVLGDKTTAAQKQPKKRRNFSIKPGKEYLDRVVNSWITKSDFVTDKNESMRKFSKRVDVHHNTITRAIAERLQPASKKRKRGKPSLLDHEAMVQVCQLAKRHIEQSGGYQRKEMIAEVIKASGGKLTLKQATNTWTHTVHPLGKKLGLINGPMHRSKASLAAQSKVERQQKTQDEQLAELGLMKGPTHRAKVTSPTASIVGKHQKTQEEQLTEQALQHDKEMNCVYAMLGVEIGGRITREHIDQLKTIKQIDAVAWCKCNRKVFSGTLTEKLESLKKLFEQNMMSI